MVRSCVGQDACRQGSCRALPATHRQRVMPIKEQGGDMHVDRRGDCPVGLEPIWE